MPERFPKVGRVGGVVTEPLLPGPKVLKSPKITKRAVDILKLAERERVVWDDDIERFGVRVHPSGAKAYLVNYRAGDGGRKAGRLSSARS